MSSHRGMCLCFFSSVGNADVINPWTSAGLCARPGELTSSPETVWLCILGCLHPVCKLEACLLWPSVPGGLARSRACTNKNDAMSRQLESYRDGATPSLLSGHYAAAKVRKELYVTRNRLAMVPLSSWLAGASPAYGVWLLVKSPSARQSRHGMKSGAAGYATGAATRWK